MDEDLENFAPAKSIPIDEDVEWVVAVRTFAENAYVKSEVGNFPVFDLMLFDTFLNSKVVIPSAINKFGVSAP